MKYSIIIPTLNEEVLLEGLLKYLTSEREKYGLDYEIIVSDGASTDKTCDVAVNYCDKLTVHQDENRRQTISEGRNKGAEVAEGDIFVFINGDVDLRNVTALLTEIGNDLSTGKYIAWTCCVNIAPEERKFSDTVFLGFYNFYFNLLNQIGIGMGRGECQVVPAENFRKFNGYDASIVAGEDFEFFKRLRQNGKIKFSKNYTIYESPRRYRKKGHLRILLTWLVNSIFVLFTKKSLSQNWEEVR